MLICFNKSRCVFVLPNNEPFIQRVEKCCACIGIYKTARFANWVAEYALRDINKPKGVSEYELAQSLPMNMKSGLPTIEEIEEQLNR